MRPTLAFYGEKKLNPNLVNDALGDHLRYGPLQSDGYFLTKPDTIVPDLVFAADTAEGVEALAPILEWSARADLGYSVILRDGLAAPDLEGDTDTVERVGDAVTRLAELLREDEEDGEDAALVLLSDMEEFDQSVTDLIRLTDGTVLVYNLGDALLPVDVNPFLVPEDDQPADQHEPSAEEPPAPGNQALDKVADQERSMFAAMRDDLDDLEQSVIGKIRAMRDLVDIYEDEFEQELADREPAPAHADGGEVKAAPVPAKVGDQGIEVVKPTKTKREWKDPATGEWKPMGRGRPRRDVETREVAA